MIGTKDKIYEKGDIIIPFDQKAFLRLIAGTSRDSRSDIQGEFVVVLDEPYCIEYEGKEYCVIGVKSLLSENYYEIVNMLHSIPYKK